MTQPQKVAIITGASRGIGAALVPAYRKLGYAVVAVARSIETANDPMCSPSPPTSADRGRGPHRRRGPGTLRPSRHPGQQRRHLRRQTVHRLHRRGLRRRHRREPAWLLRAVPQRRRRDARAGRRPCGQRVDQPGRSRQLRVPSALASLTKGGLNAVTKSLAIEYADRGIRANAVALGHHPHARCTRRRRTPPSPRLHPLGRMGDDRRCRRRRPVSGNRAVRHRRDPARRRRPERRTLMSVDTWKGDLTMEYFVEMTTHVPDGTPESAVDTVRSREAARARELAAEGHLLGCGVHRWRPVNGARSACSPLRTIPNSTVSWPRCRCTSGAPTRSRHCQSTRTTRTPPGEANHRSSSPL